MRSHPILAAALSLSAALPAHARQDPATDAAFAAEAAAAGTKCGWIGDGERDALHLLRDERLATIEVKAGAPAAAAARQAVAQASARGAATSCDGPTAARAKEQVTGVSVQVLAQWIARADAFHRYSVANAWAQDITTLDAQRAKIGAAVAAFAASPDFAPLKQKAAQEAAIVIVAICPERSSVRFVRGTRPCPPNPHPQNLAVARTLLAGAEAIVPIYDTIRGRQQAAMIAAKPYDGADGFAFVANWQSESRLQQLNLAQINPGFLFDGKMYAEEWETRAAIQAAIQSEFSCKRPGTLVWHAASPDSVSETIGARKLGQTEYVKSRVTAPLRRVGKAGTVGTLTVVYEEPRDLMTRAITRKQTRLAIEKAEGEAATLTGGQSLLPCP